MNLRILTAAASAAPTLGIPAWSHEGHDHGAPPPAAARAAPRAEAQNGPFRMVAASRGASLEIHLDRSDTHRPAGGATTAVETPAGPAPATVDGDVPRPDAPRTGSPAPSTSSPRPQLAGPDGKTSQAKFN